MSVPYNFSAHCAQHLGFTHFAVRRLSGAMFPFLEPAVSNDSLTEFFGMWKIGRRSSVQQRSQFNSITLVPNQQIQIETMSFPHQIRTQ